MSAIAYPSSALRVPRRRVADEFVLELRTQAARRPAPSVRPLTAEEVAVAVRLAADEGHELRLDLSAMKRIVVDPVACTARVQPGVTAAELEQAAFHWGLGPLSDRNGLVPANLLGARVVTAGGELVDADERLLAELRTRRARCTVVEATYRLLPAEALRR